MSSHPSVLVQATLAIFLSVCVPPTFAHELRPALLELIERPNHRYDILWKQPTMGEVAVHLEPKISGGLLDRPPTDIHGAAGFQLRRWRNVDAGEQGLEGRALTIDG